MAGIAPIADSDRRRLDRAVRALNVASFASTAGVTPPTVYRALRGEGLHAATRHMIVEVLDAFDSLKGGRRG
jgi:DNA-binding phage protein